jgi:hypothetical protein
MLFRTVEWKFDMIATKSSWNPVLRVEFCKLEWKKLVTGWADSKLLAGTYQTQQVFGNVKRRRKFSIA